MIQFEGRFTEETQSPFANGPYLASKAIRGKEMEMLDNGDIRFMNLEDYDRIANSIINILTENRATYLEANEALEYTKLRLRYQKVSPSTE